MKSLYRPIERNKRVLAIAFLTLAIAGLYVLFVILAEQEHVRIMQGSVALLVASALANEVALIVYGLRLQSLVRVVGGTLAIRDALRIHLQSLFYFFFVPFGVGADLARIVKLRNAAPQLGLHGVAGTVVLDRVAAVVSSASIAAVGGIFLVPAMDLAGVEYTYAALLAFALGAGVVVARRLLWPRVRALANRLAQFEAFRRALLLTILLALLTHVFMGVATWIASRAIGLEMELATVIIGTALSLFGALVPMTIAGAGATEALGVAAFVLLGCSLQEAITLAAFGYVGRLLGAVQGGIWEICVAAKLSVARK